MFEKVTETLNENVKKATDTARDTGKTFYFAGLGAFATAEEETKGFFDRLVDRGKTYDENRTDYVKEATKRARTIGQKVEDRVETNVAKTLNRVGVPSRKEIRTLINRVEKLTKKVDELNAN